MTLGMIQSIATCLATGTNSYMHPSIHEEQVKLYDYALTHHTNNTSKHNILVNSSITFSYLCIFKYTKAMIVKKYVFKNYKTQLS